MVLFENIGVARRQHGAIYGKVRSSSLSLLATHTKSSGAYKESVVAVAHHTHSSWHGDTRVVCARFVVGACISYISHSLDHWYIFFGVR